MRVQRALSASRQDAESFPGFTSLNANFLYCPNQFFDVCLPHSSRGAVRLVAYLLRRTLGWRDKNGQPIEQYVTVSYQDLITEAGISRGAIRAAIDEAIAAGFILCQQAGVRGALLQAGRASCFALRWDAEREYRKHLAEFHGFFAGEGHRSPIPNGYFDRVVPHESHAVVKVVGTVLRHTVGYETQFGRRDQAPLSFSYIQTYAEIGDRTTVSQAVREAIAKGYIRRVEDGVFHPRVNQRRPASYAVKWLATANPEHGSSKSLPAQSKQFKNPTSTSPKSRPAEQFTNQTNRKTDSNNTFKQQTTSVAVEYVQVFSLLRDAGFDVTAATKLCREKSVEQISQQIGWFAHRKPSTNPLGMLRTAIEQDWSEPVGVQTRKKQQRVQEVEVERAQKKVAEEVAEGEVKRHRLERQQQLQKAWLAASEHERRHWLQVVIDQAPNMEVRSNLRRRSSLETPPREALEEMARDRAMTRGESSLLLPAA